MATGPFKVTIVEDDVSMRRSLERLLSVHGFLVQSFSSAEAFLAASHEGQVDCLVLDIHLPGMSGIELRSQLDGSGQVVPVVFITAIDDDELEQEIRRWGCVDYLRKPFAPETLISAVNHAVSERPAG